MKTFIQLLQIINVDGILNITIDQNIAIALVETFYYRAISGEFQLNSYSVNYRKCS